MARPHAILRTQDQWSRCGHTATSLDPETGGVLLSWLDDEVAAPGNGAVPEPGGLAFDSRCRLFRAVPDEGRVERLLWRPRARLEPRRSPEPQPADLLGGGRAAQAGQFAVDEPAGGRLRSPRGLAVDVDDRLFVAESGARRILVYDLVTRRLVRAVRLDGRPLDLAVRGLRVWALCDDPPALVRLEARGGPWPAEVLPIAEPARVAIEPRGGLLVLDRNGRISTGPDVPSATDLELDGDGRLVVARGPGDDFVRFRRAGVGWIEDVPLSAQGYDGLGIVRTPEGRIGYWSSRGFRTAALARVRYGRVGRVAAYRLDAGEPQNEWGRLFLDACVPHGTELLVHTATADEQPEEPTVPRTPPGNVADLVVPRPDLSPPLAPLSLTPAAKEVAGRLHRRETGLEAPWLRPPADDAFETYEASVLAPPGRFLWVTLELRGTGRSTPRVRSLRAERVGHGLMRRLPKIYSRDVEQADFLRRYLALAEGPHAELDARSAERHSLVDPRVTPAELLPWLASFLGLALDERWPERRRRTLLRLAPDLFRLRGTVWGLKTFLDVCLDTQTIVIEHWRLRGLGAPLVGPATQFIGSVVGANLWVGGAVGEREGEPLEGSVADAFATHAHRFTVVVPALLNEEELGVVRQVLTVHRPAHTIFAVCTLGTGMRVGRGLHVGLLSIVGRSSGWKELVVGEVALGRGAVVGRHPAGARAGNATLGRSTRVG
jgi:phage tail-like protein